MAKKGNSSSINYEIKSFQRDFLESQSKLGREVMENWYYSWQSTLRELAHTYSQPDFDPETKLYAFVNDEMIGFITAKVIGEEDGVQKAFLEFPFVKEGHLKAEELLIERAFTVLREKGIKVVRTRAGYFWGKTLDLAKRYGYTRPEELAYFGETDVASVNLSKFPAPEQVEVFDYDRHSELLREAYVKQGWKEETIEHGMEWTEGQSKKAVANFMIGEEGAMVGYVNLPVNKNESHIATIYLQVFSSTEERRKKYIGQLLAAVANACKEKHIETLRFFAWKSTPDTYALLSSEWKPCLWLYEKKL